MADLQAVNRNNTPWIVVGFHRRAQTPACALCAGACWVPASLVLCCGTNGAHQTCCIGWINPAARAYNRQSDLKLPCGAHVKPPAATQRALSPPRGYIVAPGGAWRHWAWAGGLPDQPCQAARAFTSQSPRGRPIYTSSLEGGLLASDLRVAADLREAFEEVFFQYEVDLTWSGARAAPPLLELFPCACSALLQHRATPG